MVIVFKNLDGTCGLIIPASDDSIEEIAKKDVPFGLSWRITTIDNIPTDRYFRNAWTDNNPTPTIDVDMEKAKNIHLQNIRNKRADKFIELGFPIKLDSDLEKNLIPQETRDKLQALRDIPQNIDLSTAITPEELKTIWPKELA